MKELHEKDTDHIPRISELIFFYNSADKGTCRPFHEVPYIRLSSIEYSKS